MFQYLRYILPPLTQKKPNPKQKPQQKNPTPKEGNSNAHEHTAQLLLCMCVPPPLLMPATHFIEKPLESQILKDFFINLVFSFLN